MGDAEFLLAESFQRSEFVGGPPAVDGQMVGGRAQVLPDRHDVDADRGQIGERGPHLVGGLAHPDDHPGLGREPVRLGPSENGEAAGIAGRGSHGALETSHGLDVVVEHLGPGIADGGEVAGRTPQIRDQDLDADAGARGMNGPHRGGHDAGTAVVEVVSRDHREHGEIEIESADGLGDPFGFVRVGYLGFAGVDEAEPTGSRAALAQEHERGRALVPALEDVGAACFFAHGDEPEFS